MPSKTYSEEFKRDAVALYENSPGSSIAMIATDLGANRNTLQNWLKKYGTGTNISSSTQPSSAESLSEAERIRQLEHRRGHMRVEIALGR